MTATGQELEVKFYVRALGALEKRLQALGARQEQPRTYEANLRFDTPEGRLTAQRQVLRLRQDSAARLTFKGPGREVDGIQQRQELEFVVSDYAAAQAFLEALGYQVAWMYEKYRQVYALDPVLVTLDETPFGSFVEIEGPDGESIRQAAAELGLDWEKRILDSYAALFEKARQEMGFTFRDMSFANFAGLGVAPEALGVRAADQDEKD
jgi:adenylate cyclase, class 2